ncbi:LysM peptidoglycan-binding domain-containing protein [Clostridium sp. AM58-1XD]|uniref:CIS tube protein n=1 Tax=Clostridium sp. AM58-1XD TaxID=2292307 RepID=UPI000E529B88|nr:LysM peptidoglycan-binding domain-containing protein [Clostridium sp. AM58-1XD]RGY98569.1 LysM peptidoglycan-binding domain-containing protein [Clostridium sp. AM58-1XD]
MPGELQKARIIVYKKDKITEDKTITCMFNPAEYTIRCTTKYARNSDKEKNTQDLQYVEGEGRELSLSLYFDTSIPDSEGYYQAVTEYTDDVVKLTDVDGDQHRPPAVSFSWGNLNFKGMVTSLNQTFTYFGIDGMPLRAKIDLTISSISSEADNKAQPKSSPDRTKYRTVIQGSSLWKIAYEEYDDCEKWKLIAEANGIQNPLDIRPGCVLKVPALKEE